MNRELYELSYILKKQRQHRIAAVVLFIVSVVVGITLVLSFLMFPVRQESVSMQPDIVKGAVVLFTPIRTVPDRGSVVLLKPQRSRTVNVLSIAVTEVCRFFTAQQYSPDVDRNKMTSNEQMRRVVGLPGDTIYVKDYIAYVKPAGSKHFLTEFELSGRPYDISIVPSPAKWDGKIGVSGDYAAVTLRDGQYFVLGDNRLGCVDSRLWGPVSSSRIHACALLAYFPFSRGRLF